MEEPANSTQSVLETKQTNLVFFLCGDSANLWATLPPLTYLLKYVNLFGYS